MASKKYSKTKLDFFKKSIESKLDDVVHDLGDIKNNLDQNTKDSNSMSQNSVYSVHMADAGTDSYEREKGYHFMNRETDYYKHLSKALERINKLPKDEKKFAKGLFLHKYLVLIAHKGKVNFSIRS